MLICCDCYREVNERDYVKGSVVVHYDKDCEVCGEHKEVCYYICVGDLEGSIIFRVLLDKN